MRGAGNAERRHLPAIEKVWLLRGPSLSLLFKREQRLTHSRHSCFRILSGLSQGEEEEAKRTG